MERPASCGSASCGSSPLMRWLPTAVFCCPSHCRASALNSRKSVFLETVPNVAVPSTAAITSVRFGELDIGRGTTRAGAAFQIQIIRLARRPRVRRAFRGICGPIRHLDLHRHGRSRVEIGRRTAAVTDYVELRLLPGGRKDDDAV